MDALTRVLTKLEGAEHGHDHGKQGPPGAGARQRSASPGAGVGRQSGAGGGSATRSAAQAALASILQQRRVRAATAGQATTAMSDASLAGTIACVSHTWVGVVPTNISIIEGAPLGPTPTAAAAAAAATIINPLAQSTAASLSKQRHNGGPGPGEASAISSASSTLTPASTLVGTEAGAAGAGLSRTAALQALKAKRQPSVGSVTDVVRSKRQYAAQPQGRATSHPLHEPPAAQPSAAPVASAPSNAAGREPTAGNAPHEAGGPQLQKPSSSAATQDVAREEGAPQQTTWVAMAEGTCQLQAAGAGAWDARGAHTEQRTELTSSLDTHLAGPLAGGTGSSLEALHARLVAAEERARAAEARTARLEAANDELSAQLLDSSWAAARDTGDLGTLQQLHASLLVEHHALKLAAAEARDATDACLKQLAAEAEAASAREAAAVGLLEAHVRSGAADKAVLQQAVAHATNERDLALAQLTRLQRDAGALANRKLERDRQCGELQRRVQGLEAALAARDKEVRDREGGRSALSARMGVLRARNVALERALVDERTARVAAASEASLLEEEVSLLLAVLQDGGAVGGGNSVAQVLQEGAADHGTLLQGPAQTHGNGDADAWASDGVARQAIELAVASGKEEAGEEGEQDDMGVQHEAQEEDCTQSVGSNVRLAALKQQLSPGPCVLRTTGAGVRAGTQAQPLSSMSVGVRGGWDGSPVGRAAVHGRGAGARGAEGAAADTVSGASGKLRTRSAPRTRTSPLRKGGAAVAPAPRVASAYHTLLGKTRDQHTAAPPAQARPLSGTRPRTASGAGAAHDTPAAGPSSLPTWSGAQPIPFAVLKPTAALAAMTEAAAAHQPQQQYSAHTLALAAATAAAVHGVPSTSQHVTPAFPSLSPQPSHHLRQQPARGSAGYPAGGSSVPEPLPGTSPLIRLRGPRVGGRPARIRAALPTSPSAAATGGAILEAAKLHTSPMKARPASGTRARAVSAAAAAARAARANPGAQRAGGTAARLTAHSPHIGSAHGASGGRYAGVSCMFDSLGGGVSGAPTAQHVPGGLSVTVVTAITAASGLTAPIPRPHTEGAAWHTAKPGVSQQLLTLHEPAGASSQVPEVSVTTLAQLMSSGEEATSRLSSPSGSSQQHVQAVHRPGSTGVTVWQGPPARDAPPQHTANNQVGSPSDMRSNDADGGASHVHGVAVSGTSSHYVQYVSAAAHAVQSHAVVHEEEVVPGVQWPQRPRPSTSASATPGGSTSDERRSAASVASSQGDEGGEGGEGALPAAPHSSRARSLPDGRGLPEDCTDEQEQWPPLMSATGAPPPAYNTSVHPTASHSNSNRCSHSGRTSPPPSTSPAQASPNQAHVMRHGWGRGQQPEDGRAHSPDHTHANAWMGRGVRVGRGGGEDAVVGPVIAMPLTAIVQEVEVGEVGAAQGGANAAAPGGGNVRVRSRSGSPSRNRHPLVSEPGPHGVTLLPAAPSRTGGLPAWVPVDLSFGDTTLMASPLRPTITNYAATAGPTTNNAGGSGAGAANGGAVGSGTYLGAGAAASPSQAASNYHHYQASPTRLVEILVETGAGEAHAAEAAEAAEAAAGAGLLPRGVVLGVPVAGLPPHVTAAAGLLAVAQQPEAPPTQADDTSVAEDVAAVTGRCASHTQEVGRGGGAPLPPASPAASTSTTTASTATQTPGSRLRHVPAVTRSPPPVSMQTHTSSSTGHAAPDVSAQPASQQPAAMLQHQPPLSIEHVRYAPLSPSPTPTPLTAGGSSGSTLGGAGAPGAGAERLQLQYSPLKQQLPMVPAASMQQGSGHTSLQAGGTQPQADDIAVASPHAGIKEHMAAAQHTLESLNSIMSKFRRLQPGGAVSVEMAAAMLLAGGRGGVAGGAASSAAGTGSGVQREVRPPVVLATSAMPTQQEGALGHGAHALPPALTPASGVAVAVGGSSSGVGLQHDLAQPTNHHIHQLKHSNISTNHISSTPLTATLAATSHVPRTGGRYSAPTPSHTSVATINSWSGHDTGGAGSTSITSGTDILTTTSHGAPGSSGTRGHAVGPTLVRPLSLSEVLRRPGM